MHVRQIQSAWAAVFLLTSGVAAETFEGDSLDWLVVSHPGVAVVGSTVQVLKGGLPELAPPGDGRQELVFFDMAGKRTRAFDLIRPESAHGSAVAITASFEVLTTREAILAAVLERLGRPLPPCPLRPLRVEVRRSAARDALCPGRVCHLLVPADADRLPSLIEQALRAEEPSERATAAWRLAAYPGARTEEVLRALLSDPGREEARITGFTWVDSPEGMLYTKNFTVYPARQAAWSALEALGVNVPKPEGWVEELRYSFQE